MSVIKLQIAYDGTHYLGWQKTATGPSIEEALCKVLEHIFNEPISLQAASRTDRGVHALGQVACFSTTKKVPCLQKLQIGINALLPKDIVILEIEEMAQDFHPTLHVQTKIYTYAVCHGKVQLPCHRFYSWHYHYPLDLSLLQKGASLLQGTHDFSSFCNQKKNEKYTNHVRTVDSIEVKTIAKERLLFEIQGTQFLYKMVRNLVGTLVYIGHGKLQLSSLESILQNKNRALAGVTAPAHGLTLYKVKY